MISLTKRLGIVPQSYLLRLLSGLVSPRLVSFWVEEEFESNNLLDGATFVQAKAIHCLLYGLSSYALPAYILSYAGS
jgi:hypothetical protein